MIPVNWINVAAGLAMASGGAMLLYQLFGLIAGMPAPARQRHRFDLVSQQVVRSRGFTRTRRRRYAQDRAVTHRMPAVELRALLRAEGGERGCHANPWTAS